MLHQHTGAEPVFYYLSQLNLLDAPQSAAPTMNESIPHASISGLPLPSPSRFFDKRPRSGEQHPHSGEPKSQSAGNVVGAATHKVASGRFSPFASSARKTMASSTCKAAKKTINFHPAVCYSIYRENLPP